MLKKPSVILCSMENATEIYLPEERLLGIKCTCVKVNVYVYVWYVCVCVNFFVFKALNLEIQSNTNEEKTLL